MRTRILAVGLLAAGLLAACATPPVAPDRPTVITGTLKSVAGQPLAGMVLLERGELHGNVWDRGTLAGPDGTFRIEVARGGQYGAHIYASGYFYRPQPMMVPAGESVHLDLVLAPQPTRDREPVIKRIGFFPGEARERAITHVKMEVTHPLDILGPQVMAFDSATGRAYAMKPPGTVKDLKANFPQGVYELAVDTSTRPIDPRQWYFVVADHACFTTDVIAYPHQPAPPQVVR